MAVESIAGQELRTPAAYQQAKAECDLVMKGGITSGIVYPLAVCELARTYKLKNIGGASAGAIAAAASAAAEYGRDTDAGFVRLAGLPTELSAMDGRRTRLLRLFQPEPATRPLFGVLQAFIAAEPKGGRPLAVAVACSSALFRSWRGILILAALLLPGAVLLATATGSPATALWSLAAVLLPLVVSAAARLLARPDSAAPPPTREEAAPPLTLEELAAAEEDAVRRIADARQARKKRQRRRMIRLLAVGAIAAAVSVGVVLVAPNSGRVALGILGWTVIAIGLVIAVVSELARIAFRDIPGNLYGVCSGAGGRDGDRALTPWLSELIDETAGVREPLTFGHLWAGPGVPPIRGRDEPPAEPVINLQMMTTALTKGCPFRIPLPAGEFMFDPRELRRLFDDRIVDWMVARANEVKSGPGFARSKLLWGFADDLLPLPAASDLPVVVAARMSLSFPGLLSAVPLYAVDWTRDHNIRWRTAYELLRKEAGRGKSEEDLVAWIRPRLAAQPMRPVSERVWFSDGGITSNFPVHFFDTVLPKRPTFGINLRPFHPDAVPDPNDPSRNVNLATHNNEGRLAPFTDFERNGPSLLGFLGSIKTTMQNWADNQQLPISGYRDRIAHVSLGADEGGMNLDMPAERIEPLTLRGQAAAAALVRQFTQPVYGTFTGWDNHRWLRLRTALGLLVPALQEMRATLQPNGTSPALDYAGLLDLPVNKAPSYQWPTQSVRMAALDLLEQIQGLVDQEELKRVGDRAPRPRPRLRIVPRD